MGVSASSGGAAKRLWTAGLCGGHPARQFLGHILQPAPRRGHRARGGERRASGGLHPARTHRRPREREGADEAARSRGRPDSARRSRPHPHRGRGEYGSGDRDRRRQLPHVRGRLRRPGHGGEDSGQRQDPSPRGVQCHGDHAGARGGSRRVSAAGCACPRGAGGEAARLRADAPDPGGDRSGHRDDGYSISISSWPCEWSRAWKRPSIISMLTAPGTPRPSSPPTWMPPALRPWSTRRTYTSTPPRDSPTADSSDWARNSISTQKLHARGPMSLRERPPPVHHLR